jgi:hypothetical protein
MAPGDGRVSESKLGIGSTTQDTALVSQREDGAEVVAGYARKGRSAAGRGGREASQKVCGQSRGARVSSRGGSEGVCRSPQESVPPKPNRFPLDHEAVLAWAEPAAPDDHRLPGTEGEVVLFDGEGQEPTGEPLKSNVVAWVSTDLDDPVDQIDGGVGAVPLDFDDHVDTAVQVLSQAKALEPQGLKECCISSPRRA